MEALRFIADTLLWLLTLAFVLRFLLQLARADFRDPMADAIVRVTNWLILPLRRLLPPLGKVDTATVLAVLLMGATHTAVMGMLSGTGLMNPVAFLVLTAVDLAVMVLKIYLFALLLYWVATLLAQSAYAPGVRLLGQLCEPLVKRVRRVIPPIGQIDFSFLWLSIAIGALLILLR